MECGFEAANGNPLTRRKQIKKESGHCKAGGEIAMTGKFGCRGGSDPDPPGPEQFSKEA